MRAFDKITSDYVQVSVSDRKVHYMQACGTFNA